MVQPIASPEIERHYALIGQALLDQLPAGAGRALVYAECEPGVVGCDVFFEQGDAVCFSFATPALADAFGSLWRAMRAHGGEVWRSAVFTLEGTHFDLAYVYADRFDGSVDATVRREPHLRAFFGAARVDYTPV